MQHKWTFKAKRSDDVALEYGLKQLRRDELNTLRQELLGTPAVHDARAWDIKIISGVGFSAVPKNVDAIRQVLGIRPEHTVVVAPVFSGEWSKIHPEAIGIDFSRTALKKHPNPAKILADLRNIPLEDGIADHVVSYEPTPLHAGTASPADVLATLRELTRIGNSVHIIQRAKNKTPLWVTPFLLKYLTILGIPYRIIDITKHVQLRTRIPYRVVSVTIDGAAARENIDTISKDVRVAKAFTQDVANGQIVSARQHLRKGSSALRSALLSRYLAWALASKLWRLPKEMEK